MKFLFASCFFLNWNSGGSGTVLATGEGLIKRGHSVDYLWRDQQSWPSPHARLSRLFDVPQCQYQQVHQQLKKADYDVVVVSQSYSYLIFERLPKLFPNTLFLNRTHGWEDRLSTARLKWGWDFNKMSANWCLAQVSKFFVRSMCQRTASACHGLIAPANKCADFITRSYDVSEDKIAVIPHGISEEFVAAATASEKHSTQIKLLYVGNYTPLKGIHLLESILPALGKEYPDLMLTFVVPQEVVDRIKLRYGHSFGDRLTVYEWRPRSEIVKFYCQHDVLLYPSLFDGFGKVVLEAMSCGMCVVGFSEGILPDIARSGESALFCNTGDKEEFKRLLRECLTNSKIVSRIGRMAQKVAREYTWDKTAEMTEQFCLSVLKNVAAK